MSDKTRMRNRTLTALAATSLALTLTACGDSGDASESPEQGGIVTEGDVATDDATTADGVDDPTEDTTEADDATDEATDGSGAADGANAGLAVLGAIALAEAEAGGTAFEVDEDDRRWEISVAVGDEVIEVEVDHEGTEVIRSRPDGSLSRGDRAGLEAANVTIGEGIVIALGEVSGTVEDVDLDRARGVHAWEVTIEHSGGDTEVYVDVATGDILRVDTD